MRAGAAGVRQIAVASGKGGTGKTLVATNLAQWFAERRAPSKGAVFYVDADVETPNGHLFLLPSHCVENRLSVQIPTVDPARCTGCGACQHACAFQALLVVPAPAQGPPTQSEVMFFGELCHSCGACVLACPTGALSERPREIGTIRRAASGPVSLLWGTLDVGEPRATPLIGGVLERVPSGALAVVDAPPGTSCAAMEAVRRADLVVLVTEPTPFGLHDLALALEMCRKLERPVVAVLNRTGPEETEADRYLARQGVPLLARIPFDREIAAAYAAGRLAAEASPPLAEALEAIAAYASRSPAGREAAP